MSGAVARFAASMKITYEQWHDGVGYDLDAIKAATPAERLQIEALLLDRGVKNWRDLEALEALGTDTAIAAIREAANSHNPEIRLRATQLLAHEPDGAAAREAAIIHGIEAADLFGGLSQALDAAAEHPTPAIKDALFRCALIRTGEAAVNAAGLLYFLYGVTKEPFDWSRRPMFLRFAEAPAERRKAFGEMCAELNVDPEKYY